MNETSTGKTTYCYDACASLDDLLRRGGFDAAGNRDGQAQVQLGNGLQVGERGLAGSLGVQAGVDTDDLRAELGGHL